MLLKSLPQFCKHGHNTLIVGRSKLGYCKECDRIRHRTAYLKHFPQKSYQSKIGKRLQRYKVTVQIYNSLLESQNGLCRICHKPPTSKALSVDHDHKTQRIRGLLCQKCNLMLGFALDDISILKAGIEYLSL